MPNVIGSIPEFTSDEGVIEEGNKVEEKVEEPQPDSAKETPSEPPAEEKPVEPAPKEQPNVDTEQLARQRAVQGLEEEIARLKQDIVELRGTRRDLKEQKLEQLTAKVDELKDVAPEDINLVEKILRSKGYITKGEADNMFYEAVKSEELRKFLEKYPEYKPENDPSDSKWNRLEKEIRTFYRNPIDPREWAILLERGHREVSRLSERAPQKPVQETKRQLEVAGMGSGGRSQRSSSKSLDPERRFMLQQGGWSEEEIKKIEQKLS